VQHDIGLMRVAQGDHERAVPLLEEAAAGYAALGMDSWAARVAALRESVS
jgi:hypothetical protein